jgi:hypothetical protein
MRLLVRSAFLSFAALLIINSGFAQPGDPQGDPDLAVPIQGLGYLITAGVLLGVKKIIGKKQNIK